MQFILNAQEMSLTIAKDLRRYLEQIRQRQFSELWLSFGDDRPSLTMLINGVSAWLIYQQDQADAGMHSLNPFYHGTVELRLEFQLSNGQMDKYPVAWVL